MINENFIKQQFKWLQTHLKREKSNTKYPVEEQVIQTDILSIEQIKDRAETLAGWHKTEEVLYTEKLLFSLDKNKKVLFQSYQVIIDSIEKQQRITPAVEWFIDNFYLIEEQIIIIYQHFSKSYSRQLPRLKIGPRKGYPRVYDIVSDLISHVDGKVNIQNLSVFIDSYQKITSLKLGELWAIPIMLRLALIENLRRIAVILINEVNDRSNADTWAEKLIDTAVKSPKDLILVMAKLSQTELTMTDTFVSEFIHKIQGQSPELVFPLTWLEQRLSEDGKTSEQLIQAETRRQAINQVSIANTIASLRFIDSVNWHEFVETHSVVDSVLRTDPSGVYEKMDFSTRDKYRRTIEQIAKHSSFSEEEVAKKTIELAKRKKGENPSDYRIHHIGFYLIGQGRTELKKILGLHCKWECFSGLGQNFRLMVYLGCIFSICITITTIMALYYYNYLYFLPDSLFFTLITLLSLLIFISISHPAAAIVNRIATLLIKPESLPRMDFSKEIPSQACTAVVVPCLLINHLQAKNLLEGIKIRYLANKDKNLFFGLLTDFRDAQNQNMPDDEKLLAIVSDGIRSLNKKYGTEKFFLLHRNRQWNPVERKWMGYERKRGKLIGFTLWLRERNKGGFLVQTAAEKIPETIKYVITLDTDTNLPRDTARSMIEIMEHPLNRPEYDEKRQCVSSGYGVVQPRLAINLSSTNVSLFSRIFCYEPGIDPYTRAVSDVYQDVFREGSFTGKGIYDVDVFIKVLAQRFPENRILSHDLLESCYLRSGLASDIQIYEDFPSKYDTDVNRRHRWIRGDWQIAVWLFPNAPGAKIKTRSHISLLCRWKLFDNLRRSIVPPALFIITITGWLFFNPAWFWTFMVISIILIPYVLHVLDDIFRKPQRVPAIMHIRTISRRIFIQAFTGIFQFIFLPHETFYNLDAIIRTINRILFTRRGLLEWQTFQEAKNTATQTTFYRSMLAAPAAAVVLMIYFALNHFYGAASLYIWLPLFLWFISPAIAWKLSQPIKTKTYRLTGTQNLFLHKLARKTWRYFEDFVSEEDNWLPPDNYQEYPDPKIAHRTSPTNIGIYLVSNLSAFDFGYLSTQKFLSGIEETFRTMGKMERFRGHFYNWYNTRSMEPLPPLYVSTVDSGNLAGYLLILKQGLLELAEKNVLPDNLFQGLEDTLFVIRECFEKSKTLLSRERNFLRYWLSNISGKLRECKKMHPGFSTPTKAPENGKWNFIEIKAQMSWFIKQTEELIAYLHEQNDREIMWWTSAFLQQIKDNFDDLIFLLPWLELEIPAELSFLTADLLKSPLSLNTLIKATKKSISEIEKIMASPSRQNLTSQEKDFLTELSESFHSTIDRAGKRLITIEEMSILCEEFSNYEYEFLYDKHKLLLSIGYNASEHLRDKSLYDLLSSEARLGSFLAIAIGALPQKHWFALGRPLTTVTGNPALLSWSGSLFEYLMPLLIMPSYPDTLLDNTYKTVVKTHIEYAKKQGVPWGISESCYGLMDADQNYQYGAFGVPSLGFKRGLAENLVIAPYSSVMGLMVFPEESYENLYRMEHEGFIGTYGFYESVDYTPTRVLRGQSRTIIRTFMSHHQAMTLLSLCYLLLDKPMQRRFLSNPVLKSAEQLLQEKVPESEPFYPRIPKSTFAEQNIMDYEKALRIFHSPNTPVPEVHLLSNAHYHVMITNSGAGYSKWNEIGITRWREDITCDTNGLFCYIRDIDSGKVWSACYQPTGIESILYEAIFMQGRAEFRRHDGNFITYTEIAVSPEDDVEIRRISITNRSHVSKELELTTYTEIVLSLLSDDATHPVFNNLFVQSEIIPDRKSIIFTRRTKTEKERPLWLFNMLSTKQYPYGDVSYETDRLKFIGRERTLANPVILDSPGRLSNTSGNVLDPISAIRIRLTIAPEATERINIVMGVSENRENILKLIEKYSDYSAAERIFDLAWTHSHVVLSQLNINESDAQTYNKLAGSIIFSSSLHRASSEVISKNKRRQSDLWAYGISGDLPIVLLRMTDALRINFVKQLLKAHAYWRSKGLNVDLVIWNEEVAGYQQMLQDNIMGAISSGPQAHLLDTPGGVFVRKIEQISEEGRILIQAVSRIVITDRTFNLIDQIERRGKPEQSISKFKPGYFKKRKTDLSAKRPRTDIIFNNGFGGFTPDGKEYVINLSRDNKTPAPWVNVMANPYFGTIVSENGSSYTWKENSHEFRLTPFYNDPVINPGGEAIYIRDEDSGDTWSPAPFPVRGNQFYVCRHGFGYTVFEYGQTGIVSELYIYTDISSPVKFLRLKISNHSGTPRRMSIVGYVEWVLGELRQKSAMHVTTTIDPKTGAIFARNVYSMEFSDFVAFFDVSEINKTFTGDRTEFIGRNRNLTNPLWLSRSHLSGKLGAGMDPCTAIQTYIELSEEEDKEIVFILGSGKNTREAQEIVQRFRGYGPAKKSLEDVWQHWNNILGTVYVETPDIPVNTLTNGWLLYQTISSRLWARSGFYQSSGAYGFRDQLQDSLAVLHTQPDISRSHILYCASHQFKEGDVQHWWHPPFNRGIRSRFSDDHLWLPFAVCRYIDITGDAKVLDEKTSYIQGRLLNPEEQEYYDLPGTTNETDSLYQHCVCAIKYSLRFGIHGLPLIGSGDWNDGMNRVGRNGQGESVWLAFFLYDVLTKFAKLAKKHGDVSFASQCEKEAVRLNDAINQTAWDEEWYVRAFFDDGKPLGSKINTECKITSLPQSWAVISGAGDTDKRARAMASVEKELISWDNRLINLLAPPFDKSDLNPGYIKGYPPGIRENGGQYTHAGVWVAMAFCLLGDKSKAWKVFSLINPINRSSTKSDATVYKVEPYAVTADVYSFPPYTGKGGWTWYTGSSGWMYQLILEYFLGVQRNDNRIIFSPCIPENWQTYKIHYRYKETIYHVNFTRVQTDKISGMSMDGIPIEEKWLTLTNDKKEHFVEVKIL
ncbi:MAG: cyclic beta 1-2 glucan synthetase [Candidatus Omnitrophica bacterium]|nr:cyclic beta 1-2 glucan synthetase [Candidatus Omnitrophota bacterium]